MGNSILRGLAVLSVFASCLCAQGFSVGVKGGYPLTYSENSATGVDVQVDSSSRQFIVGAEGEVSLPFGVSVEGDFLYHPYNVRTVQTTLPASTSTTNYSIFEIPILAKLRLGHGFARPYVEAGPEFRVHFSSLDLSHAGFSVGGGVEFKLLLLKVSPEFRYTRWADSSFIGAAPNQAALLVGVTF